MEDRPWLTHSAHDVPHPISYPEQPLYASLEQAAKTKPDQASTIFKGAVVTYGEMDALSDRLAAGEVRGERLFVADGHRAVLGDDLAAVLAAGEVGQMAADFPRPVPRSKPCEPLLKI